MVLNQGPGSIWITDEICFAMKPRKQSRSEYRTPKYQKTEIGDKINWKNGFEFKNVESRTNSVFL